MPKTQSQLSIIEGNKDEHENRVVRSELNLEQWSGLFVSGQSRGRTKEIRVIEDVQKLPNGDIITNTIEIEPSIKFGTLTAKDQRVLYALFLNWKEKGSPLGYCYYSTYRLAQILRANLSGASIDSILDSLQRLNAVTLRFHHCFYDAETREKYKDQEPIHILSELKIRTREREKDGTYRPTRSEGYIAFHPRILKNLIKQYTRPVLFDVVISLESDVAQFVYSIVDRQLATKADYNITTQKLFDVLGIEGKEYHKKSRRFRALKAPLAELDGKPLSSGGYLKITQRETKDKKDLVLIFSKQQKAIAAKSTALPASPAEVPAEKELVMRLVTELGISLPVARKLEATHAKTCLEWCEAKARSRELKDKGAGYFVKAISEGWELPTEQKAVKERVEKRAVEEDKQALRAKEESEALRWEKYFEPYAAFAQAQLCAIQESNPEAYAKFDVKLKDHLKLFEHFNLAANDQVMIEATLAQADWFFNDAFTQRYKIHFVTFAEWDKEHNAAPFAK